MFDRDNLSFKNQREALAQAASNPAIDSTFGQAMQSAKALIQDASSLGSSLQGPRETGLTPDIINALRQNPNGGMAQDIASLREGLNSLSQPSPSGGAAGGFTGGDREQYLMNGLIQRGFDPETAQAFVINMKDESGLNASITEGAPNVHGTRGQGLYQLTDIAPGKGRRSDYMNFMRTQGRNDLWSDESQLDFAWWERNNTEKASWDRVAQAAGVGNKASAIVQYVLRPAEKHRIERQNRYLALGY